MPVYINGAHVTLIEGLGVGYYITDVHIPNISKSHIRSRLWRRYFQSAHSLFSNASLAPAQTLSSRLEKKSEEALLCMKSIPFDNDKEAGDDAFDDEFSFPLLTPIRTIVEMSRPMVQILRPPTRIFSVVLLSFFGEITEVEVGRHMLMLRYA